METTISTLVSNPTGNGGNAPLSAMIDKTIAEHIMTRQRFDELKNEFNWPSATPGPDEILYDSRGVTYTAQNKVSLLIRPRHGRCSERFMFYLVKSDSALFTGGHDLVLARSWLGKFPRNGLDSSRVHSAAPSELLKGKSRQERKEWDKTASEHDKENQEQAERNEAVWDEKMKQMKEHQEKNKGKGPLNGQ